MSNNINQNNNNKLFVSVQAATLTRIRRRASSTPEQGPDIDTCKFHTKSLVRNIWSRY